MLLPQTLSATLAAPAGAWQVRFSQDLAHAVLRGDELSVPCRTALLRLLPAQADQRPWRGLIDVDGVQLCVAVQPEERQLALGSERFATEQLLVQAAKKAATGEQQARWRNLNELVQAWHSARVDTPRAAVEVALADAELHTEAQIAAGEHPQAQAIWTETARLAALVNQPMRAYRPGLRENLNQWGLELASNCEPLRLHGLRFVAGLPALDHDQRGDEVARLLGQMLAALQRDSDRAAQAGDAQGTLPWWLAIGVAIGAWLVRILPARVVARTTRTVAQLVARTFIAGQDMQEAGPALAQLRASGRDATLDQLGELVVSEPEADVYCERVLGLVRAAGTGFTAGERNAAGIERAHVSVKVSALCSDYDPDDEDGTWQRVGPRLSAIFAEAHQRQVFINLDAEHYSVRNLTFAMLRRALDGNPTLRTWTGAGIVVQAYLRDAAEHCREVIAYARQRGVRMPLRLVKGAYWDAETIEADAHDHPAPQFLDKNETDVMYQALSLHILANGDVVQLCVGSHNLRDHCFAEAARQVLYPQAPPVEHQALHMTYEALSTAMAQFGWAVRNYVPVGSLLVGMAYLVRRILENSSQVGVLTAARHGVDLDVLMQPPLGLVRARHALGELPRDPQLSAVPLGQTPEFYNTAPLRLYHPEHRAAVEGALQSFAPQQLVPSADRTGATLTVRSPSNQNFAVGEIASHTPEDVAQAVLRASQIAAEWAREPAGVRAASLLRAAEQMRCERPELAALIMHESGKSRAEALGDVDEAIDFLQFYAREALRLASEFPQATARGVLAVVAPWNFPLAIPCGMASAALVAGNAVLLKSAEQTPLVVERLMQLLHGAGVPHAALQHIVGDGPSVGAPLVENPDVDGVVFTGSKAVGTMLHRTMATRERGAHTALAITEMGGKNAIVVTGNADLDEAVSGALRSAFGHAGQKCSAASRILVDQRIFEPFCARFAKAAADWRVGLAHLPGTRI
ncbi:MAG: proline dehydrogenase family protein, partial [Deltaproteobacteria bacterium]|nr:proline dehydrogenase family protein [Deltaproteobacteria bacterium]